MNSESIQDLFTKQGWTLTSGQLQELGVSWKDLYRERDADNLYEISRGVFRHSTAPAVEYLEFLAVCTRVPKGVLCLNSSLAYWTLSDEMPRIVHIAVPRGSHRPQIAWPRTKVHTFAAESFRYGATEVALSSGETLNVYTPERTLADIVRLSYRNTHEETVRLIRYYLDSPEGNIQKLRLAAEKMGCLKKMTDYIRVLVS